MSKLSFHPNIVGQNLVFGAPHAPWETLNYKDKRAYFVDTIGVCVPMHKIDDDVIQPVVDATDKNVGIVNLTKGITKGIPNTGYLIVSRPNTEDDEEECPFIEYAGVAIIDKGYELTLKNHADKKIQLIYYRPMMGRIGSGDTKTSKWAVKLVCAVDKSERDIFYISGDTFDFDILGDFNHMVK